LGRVTIYLVVNVNLRYFMLLGHPVSCQGLVPIFERIGANRGASAPSA